jgi:hypothetical protein
LDEHEANKTLKHNKNNLSFFLFTIQHLQTKK